ncbi:MAG: hypothetical protein JWO47_423 [Candidatus Saccharibacteria bacterium]|nr:hypothetical protein [Candidatus Saccharibacteria bacterium]
MGIEIEGLTALPATIDQLPLIARPRVIVEGASVNVENHMRGRDMLMGMGIDPNLGDLIIGDPNPESKCERGTLAEALAMGHGGLDSTFKEAVREADEEGVSRDVAAFRSVRAFASKVKDPETGAEQLLTVGPEPRDNSQDPSTQESLKKNSPE